MSRNVENIEPSVLKEWLSHDDVRLIDVREPAENALSSIPGGELHPLSSFDPHAIAPGPKKVVFYCRSGQRSHEAARLWSAAHHTTAYNLKGGILAYKS